MIPTVPTVPSQEFAVRYRQVQRRVGELGLDVLLINSNEADFANVRYLSNYWPLFETAAVVVPAQGDGALLIGPESERFAQDRSVIKNIYKLLEYRESADPAYPGVEVDTFDSVAKKLSMKQPRRIGVAGYLVTTAPVLDGLKSAFPSAEIIRADHILTELRSRKSPAELACLKRAFEISELAVEEMLRRVRPGMTELQLVGVAQGVMYEAGAEYEGHPTYVLSGRSTAHAISRPTHKPLARGELIQLNVGARVSGYASSVGLPICIGSMTSHMRELVEFGLEAHKQTIAWMKAGVIAADVARRYKQLFVDRGFASHYLYGPCHGLGMIEVEPPWMEEISEYPLAENMTFQVDTFLTGADFGLRWENGVRVTASGVDMFSGKFRRVIEVG
jgi:Xaa-Pro aminopeptidase